MITVIKTCSPEQTLQFSQKLAEYLKPGDIICLTGNLGAGKTLFAKGIAAGLKVQEPVTSPTFSILNIYNGKYRNNSLQIHHFDLYRLEEPEDLEDVGFYESFSANAAGLILIIEWPDKFFECLPQEYLLITIEEAEAQEPYKRQIVLSPQGARYEKLCGELSL